MENIKNILVGKVITAIHVANDREAIKFDIKDEDSVLALCDADCCSHTWVENVELPALGFPALVTEADDLDLNKPGIESSEYEYLQFYGFKIVTDKGEVVIDYRNSSNGYYGGHLMWPDDSRSFYGGVFGQNVSEQDWVQLG